MTDWLARARAAWVRGWQEVEAAKWHRARSRVVLAKTRFKSDEAKRKRL